MLAKLNLLSLLIGIFLLISSSLKRSYILLTLKTGILSTNAFMLKVDLAKAFDRLEWSFISEALHRLGLNTNFINLIHACISTPTLAVLVNDEPSDYFNPQRGLRQGCPLSPYLFVIAINELSIRLQETLHNNNLSASLWEWVFLLFIHFYSQMISFYVARPPWKKLKPLRLSSTSSVNNWVRRLIFRNPPSISAGMFLTTPKIKSKVSSLFPIFGPTLCT